MNHKTIPSKIPHLCCHETSFIKFHILANEKITYKFVAKAKEHLSLLTSALHILFSWFSAESYMNLVVLTIDINR